MNTAKTSITAIVFVIVYFSFVVFLSLFSGLSFKNLKFHNIYIKNLFIKIDKKLILKANSITIIPKQKVSEDITSIHKQLFLFSKILPLFQKLIIKNLNYKHIKIPVISYQNRQIILKTNFISLKGVVYPYRNYTILNHIDIKIKNYSLNDINGKITFKKLISFNIEGKHQNKKLNIKGYLNSKDNLNLNLFSKDLDLKFDKYSFNFKNLKADFFINLHFLTPYLDFKANKITTNNNYFFKDINFKIIKNSILFKTDKIFIKKFNKAYNIKIDFIKGTYFKNSSLLIISHNNKISLNYKNLFIKFQKNSLIYKNLNNFNFYSKKIYAKYKDFHIISKNAVVLKFNDFILFEIKNNILKSSLINIYNDIIYGYKNRIEIPNIKAKYKKINLNIINLLINIPLKKAVIEKIFINKFLFSPTFISLIKNKLDIKSFSSNIVLDNDFNKILSEFNISNPLTQLRGKNIFSFRFNYNLDSKKYRYNIDVNSSKSVFKYKNIMFSYDKLNANIKKDLIKTDVKNIFTSLDFLKVSADGNITITPTYLNAFTLIKNLKIFNFVNVNNYNEKVVIDFAKKIVYFLNSNIFINIPENEIFLLQLKNLIKYTPFINIVKDGGIFIKIAKELMISGIIELKKPLILNQEDPEMLNALIFIKDDNIEIKNRFINLYIKNLKEYNAIIKNAEIDIKNLIYFYNQLKDVFATTSNTKNSNSTFNIKSINTNFIYENHKFLSQKAHLKIEKNIHIFSKYKSSTLKGYTKRGFLLLEGKNYQKEELIALLEFFNHFDKINLDFILVKSPEDFYSGKIYINNGIVKELRALNNIIAFLNTIPSLLSLSSPGFSAKGYKIKKGVISYLFYNNILYFKNIKIKGVNIDFKGKGYIDLNKNIVNLKIESSLKMKVKKIPILGKGLSYILFGKDGNINVKIIVKGNMENPKVYKDIGKSIILTPFELFKRVITLPFNIF